jgi:hypothetical protein
VAMEMTAVCLGKLAKTATFPHSHSLGDDLEFPFSPSSFNFNFNEKCYLHARYLLLPTCPFAQPQQDWGFSPRCFILKFRSDFIFAGAKESA